MKNFILKNNSKNPKLCSMLLCVAAFASALLWTSCNNFMDAKKVKNEIVDAIAYNNAKEITLQIDSEGMGLVFPKGSITKKIGYDFEILFKPDTENYSITNKDVIYVL